MPLFTDHHTIIHQPPPTNQKTTNHCNPLPHKSQPIDPQPNHQNSTLLPIYSHPKSIHNHNHQKLIYNHN